MDYVDVLIVGVGLFGIGMVCYLMKECFDCIYVILEGCGVIGGIWDIFWYLGIWFDLDMFILGYDFKFWIIGKVIVDGFLIWEYVREIVIEYNVEKNIWFYYVVKCVFWNLDFLSWIV